MPSRRPSFTALLRLVNRPIVTLAAIAIAVLLGLSRLPVIGLLHPVGELYVALLQMCVLPFLLATIPLAVRSAMTGVTGGRAIGSIALAVFGAVFAVGLIATVIPTVAFHFAPIDPGSIAAIGALVGGDSGNADLEFALDANNAAQSVAATESTIVSMIPSNIFAALSSNDTVRVLVFAAIFGAAMVTNERRSGSSFFSGLRQLHDLCLLLFDWLNLLAPIGIIALIAPQIALFGPDVFFVLARFSYVYIAVSVLVLGLSGALVAMSLRINFIEAVARLFRPLMMAAATRNTLACIPSAVDTMTNELRVSKEACELYIPLGFATLRFGTVIFFATATIFIGALVGRNFSLADSVYVAVLSLLGSFATLGLSGAAAMVPLAAVLRPFGLSYELAFPLLVIIDPVVHMIRIMLNVAVNCAIPAMAVGREGAVTEAVPDIVAAK